MAGRQSSLEIDPKTEPPSAVEAKGGATRREPHQFTWNFLPAPWAAFDEFAMFESTRTPVA